MTEGTPGEDQRLEALVAAALQQIEDGQAPDLDALCAEAPELRAAVAESLALLDAASLRRGARSPGSLSGTVLAGRYVLSECIGAGAMGAVYKADDLELGRTVAIKVLRTEMDNRAEHERRFQREGEVLASLSHPAIATIYDRRRTDTGQPFIVMEYLEGISMQHALEDRAALGKHGHLPVREAVAHAAQLARALELAHERGIVHRDVKPSNIMLTARGAVLIDFGIATLGAHETLADGTRGVGTPAYMAPEQLRNERPAGPSVDVYGLTASLYRALTGNAPYEGTPAEVLAAIPTRDPVLPSVLRPDLSRDLLAILDVGLDRDLARRYESMAQLRADLDAFLAHAPVRARYPGPVMRLLRRVRRSKATLAAIAVALVFVVGLVGNWGYREYERARLHSMQAAYDEAMSRVQPMLTLWHPADRTIADGEARRRERELLDRAVGNAAHALPALALRAAFLWDQGERGDALTDLETLARRVPGPLASFLLVAHRAADQAGGADAELDGAPTPTTADEVFLLAFHELRRRNFKVARELLFDPRLDDCDAALEQRLLIELDGLERLSVDEASAVARRVHEAVLRMEERYGRTTAMTAHLEGIALLAQHRYQEALTTIRQGLELSPDSANLLENAAISLRRLGALDEAVGLLEAAIASRPHGLSAYRTLFWVQLERGRMGAGDALSAAKQLLEAPQIPASLRDRLRGELDLEQALTHLFSGDPEAAREAAGAALDKWRRTGNGDAFKVAVATGLSEGRSPFVEAATLAAREPATWYRLLLTFALMPDHLVDADASAVKELLLAWVQEKAPRANVADWAFIRFPDKK